MKKFFAWAIVVFLAWFIFTQPQAAGEVMHVGLEMLAQAGNAIATALKTAASHHQ